MIIGLFLIVIGIFWVLSNMGVISASISQFFWPAVIIAVGAQILWDSFRKKGCCGKEDK